MNTFRWRIPPRSRWIPPSTASISTTGACARQTLERARDHGRMVTSPDFGLQVRGRQPQRLFRRASRVPGLDCRHATVQERRDNLLGYVQGVFQTAVLIDAILRRSTNPAGLDLYWFAADATHDAPRSIFIPRACERSRSSRNRVRRSPPACTGPTRSASAIASGSFVATPTPGGPGTASRLGSSMTLIVGLLLSALVTLYIWASRSSRGTHAGG